MSRGEAKVLSIVVVMPVGVAAFFGLVWLLDSNKASGGNEALAMGVAVGALLGILYATARFSDWLYGRFGPKEKGPA